MNHPSRTRWALAGSVLASSMAFLDVTALNVALPGLQRAFSASGAELLWVVNAYALVLAAGLLVGGAAGDRWGRRRVLEIGIVLFTLASLACGLAPGVGFLIGARVVQGLGAALLMPNSLALLATAFPEEQRGRAIGTWSAWSVVATALGPIVGGLLAHAGWWRGIFFLNLPLAVAALAVLAWRTRESADPEAAGRPLDLPGMALAALGLASLNAACLEAPGRGWSHPGILAALAVAAVALVLFVAVERRSPWPLLPPALFRSRTLTAGVLFVLAVHPTFYGLLLFFPLQLIQAQGYDPARTGLTLLPVMVLLAALSRFAGGLVDRFGPRLPLTIGPLLSGAGFLLLSRGGETAGPSEFWTAYLPPLLLIGAGMALSLAPVSTAILAAVARERTGLASGINATATRLAGALGVALLGAVVLASFESTLTERARELPADLATALVAQAPRLGDARPPAGLPADLEARARATLRGALVEAFGSACLLCAGLCAGGALLAWGLMPSVVGRVGRPGRGHSQH